VNGFVTEDDIHTVVQVSEVVFCSRQLTGFIFRIVSGGEKTKEQSTTRPCKPVQNDLRIKDKFLLLENNYVSIHQLIQSLVQGDIIILYSLC